MKTQILVALIASTQAIQLHSSWESVARCKPGQVSSDSKPCDNNSSGAHNLDGTTIQTKWESVARCKAGQVSTDLQPCDDTINNNHPLDGTVGHLVQTKWESVARCKAGQVSTDLQPCDDTINNNHPLDGTVGHLVQLEYRPAIKCIEGSHGNPISCDHDDITSLNDQPLPKDENGFTPTKVILGGPMVNNTPKPKELKPKKK